MSLIMVNCLTSGAAMIAIGILGEYVGRIFEEIKNRPLYTISLTANVTESPAGATNQSEQRPQ
jgi:dolichol-phosphate mannosyltransferase